MGEHSVMVRIGVRILIGCGLGLPAHAQLVGEVREPGGEPIRGVFVELWTPGGRGAFRVSDADGRFSFPEGQTKEATGVSFSRIGFAPVSYAIALTGDPLLVILEPVALLLPELVVEVATRICPNVESPEARSIWERASSRYSRDTAERGVAMRVLRREEALVPTARIGLIEEERLRYADIQRVGATPEPEFGRFVNINSRIAATGYVVPTGLGRPRWEFRGLEGQHAHHFASETFGERHTLDLEEGGGSTVTLTFCPRGGSGTGVEGVLSISDEMTFVSASWSYRAPDGSQDAGGEVLFVPWWGESDDLPHLLSARGSFWRQEPAGSDRYFQRTSVFTGWNISLDDQMPELPRR